VPVHRIFLIDSSTLTSMGAYVCACGPRLDRHDKDVSLPAGIGTVRTQKETDVHKLLMDDKSDLVPLETPGAEVAQHEQLFPGQLKTPDAETAQAEQSDTILVETPTAEVAQAKQPPEALVETTQPPVVLLETTGIEAAHGTQPPPVTVGATCEEGEKAEVAKPAQTRSVQAPTQCTLSLEQNPALQGDASEMSEKDLEGWYMVTLKTQSGIDDFPVRVEACCMRLWIENGEKLCQFEARACLHEPSSGTCEPDTRIFWVEPIGGSWRMRPPPRKGVSLRLEARPGEVDSHKGPMLKTVSCEDLASSPWTPHEVLPRAVISAFWRRWAVLDK